MGSLSCIWLGFPSHGCCGLCYMVQRHLHLLHAIPKNYYFFLILFLFLFIHFFFFWGGGEALEISARFVEYFLPVGVVVCSMWYGII